MTWYSVLIFEKLLRVVRITQVIVVMLTLLLVAAGQVQKSWEKKSYQEWNLVEVFTILSDSPWAQTADETSRGGHNLPGASYSATIRLRSALPIRQALVRQRQLAVNYDKLSSADKKRLDAETKEFLECSDCAKYYIVTLASHAPKDSPPIGVPGVTLKGSHGVDIGAPLRNLKLNDLRSYVHLTNDRGERRALVGYIPATETGKEAMFIFPRVDDQGESLITTSHKKLHFEIDNRVFKKMPTSLKKFTFEVHRLVQNGQVLF